MATVDKNNKDIFKFIRKTRVQFNELTQDVLIYLQKIYDNTQNILTPSSPAGQIWAILTGHFTFLLFYLEDAWTESNRLTATRKASKFGLSRLSGHNPFRGRSAEGEVEVRLRRDTKNIIPSFAKILNKTKVRCINNDLVYTIVLGDPYVIFKPNSREALFLKIYEGTFEEQTVVSLGEPLESFSFTPPNGKYIDHYQVMIYVNGEEWTKVNCLQDLNYNQKGCIIKTGISGGVDLYFGNGNMGKIPERGSNITIEYLLSSGSEGNLYSNSVDVEFIWENELEDTFGNQINANENFQITLSGNLLFGNDSENEILSELINPTLSKSNVLVLEQNYEYELRKLGGYSYINVFREENFTDINNNLINIFAIPDINVRIGEGINYFDLDQRFFTLTDSEKNKLTTYFSNSNKQSPSVELKILQPTVRRYNMNLVIVAFDDWKTREEILRENIVEAISSYMLNFRRRDRLPKSDIIRIVENIPGVDSVNVYFTSEQNEKAIRNGFYNSTQRVGDNIVEVQVNLLENQDPALGLDDLGDIIIKNNEIPLIRGGWLDRNSNEIGDVISANKPSSVSIFITKYVNKSQTQLT